MYIQSKPSLVVIDDKAYVKSDFKQPSGHDSDTAANKYDAAFKYKLIVPILLLYHAYSTLTVLSNLCAINWCQEDTTILA